MSRSHYKMFIIGLIVAITLSTFMDLSECKSRKPSWEIHLEKLIDELIKKRNYDMDYFTKLPKDLKKEYMKTSHKDMVVSGDIRCSRVGQYQLQHGGNAIDAAISTHLCLSVINMQSAGLAGGGIALSIMNGRLTALDFREMAPLKIRRGQARTRTYGPLSFGIPGTPMGLYKLWKKGGSLPWPTLFELPMIIAYKGWRITPFFRLVTAKNHRFIYRNAHIRKILYNRRRLKPVNSLIRNPELAHSLYKLSKNHMEMYTGSLAKTMVNYLKHIKGAHTLDDFKNYKTRPMKLLIVRIDKDRFMITVSGRTGGPLLSYIMNSMRGHNSLSSKTILQNGKLRPEYYKILIRQLKESLLNKAVLASKDKVPFIRSAFYKYAENEKRAKREYSPNAQKTKPAPIPVNLRGTSSVTVIDQYGNGVALTSSINYFYGAKFIFPGTGIIANNDLLFYHRLNPMVRKTEGKKSYNSRMHDRTVSHMAPTMILDKKSERIVGIFAGTGGDRIATSIAQVLINIYFRGISHWDAIDEFRLFPPSSSNLIYFETAKPISRGIANYLAKNRFTLRGLQTWHSTTVQSISIKHNGQYRAPSITGIADPRKSGGAASP